MSDFSIRTMTPAAPNGRGSFLLATDLLAQFWRWLWRPLMIERQRRELNQLSDHVLKDIGLSRAGIDGISVHLIDRHVDETRRAHRR